MSKSKLFRNIEWAKRKAKGESYLSIAEDEDMSVGHVRSKIYTVTKLAMREPNYRCFESVNDFIKNPSKWIDALDNLLKKKEHETKAPKNLDGSINDLSVMTRNIVISVAGRDATKESVAALIDSGKLSVKRIPNYGKKSHKEVLEWCGIGADDTQKINQAYADRCARYLEKFGYKVVAPD